MSTLRFSKRWGRAALTLIFALGLALVAIQPAVAQSEPVAVVTAPRLNVRSGPAITYTVIGSVIQDETVTMMARTADSSWAQIRTLSGVVGWVSTYYLKSVTAFASLPIVTYTEPQAEVTALALNVREGPGLTYAIVGKVYDGDIVSLVGRNGDSSWLYIRYDDNQLGWVASAEVETDIERYTLPETTAPAVTAASQSGGGSSTGISGWLGVGTVNEVEDEVRVNTAAGNIHGILDYLVPGETVYLLGQSDTGRWLYIYFHDANLGWVRSTRIDTDVDLATLPVVDDLTSMVGTDLGTAELSVAGIVTSTSGTMAPITSTGVAATINTGALNVRSGPGPTYSVVGVVYDNQMVELVGRIPDSSWLKVATSSMAGWVDASFLDIDFDVDFLPVFTSTTGY